MTNGPINKPWAIISGNIYGLYNSKNKHKTSMIHDLAEELEAGIIMLTESHLNEEVRDAEIKIHGFDIHRMDRKNFKCGGVIFYIKSNLNLGVRNLYGLSHNKIEILILECVKINCIIACIYRPPCADGNSFHYVLSEMRRILNENAGESRTIIIGGDFNLPIINWKTKKVSGGAREQSRQAEDLMQICDEFFLNQCISEPTRLNNILDLFFTNNEEIILKTQVEARTIISDHNLQVITTCYMNTEPEENVNQDDESFRSLNFHDNTVNWEKISGSIQNIDWISKFAGKSGSQIYDIFMQLLYEICSNEVPKKMRKSKARIPRDRRILMRRRCRLRKELLNCSVYQRNKIEQKIEKIENELLISHETEEKRNEMNAISVIKECPKYFFRYARSKSYLKTAIGPFIVDGEVIYDAKDKADILLSQYTSVYSSEGHSMNLREELCSIPGPQSLRDIRFTEEDIGESIDELNVSSASGPDGIPAVLLKKCRDSVKTPLTLLWQRSLEYGEIPDLLKAGSIVPIHKGGDKSLPANYRPVALTSHVIKIIEKIIAKHIVSYMNQA